MPTTDREIRNALHRDLLRHYWDDPDSLVVDELGLCQGLARIDIAVVNGRIHGFEIKSDRDTLERLPGQCEIYNKTLDRITLVVGGVHLEKAASMVPAWWGIVEAQIKTGNIQFRTVREGKQNPSVDRFAVAQLLWRDEALEVLDELGVSKGLRSKTRSELWEKLAKELSADRLCRVVRDRVKERGNWRSA